MCFQTSDVTITSPYMRGLTIFHATISYLFALAILGLLLEGFITNINCCPRWRLGRWRLEPRTVAVINKARACRT